ncbi:hypothetical protein WICPIJ_008621 [Wickerhamomyces pijperi]|uniref:Coatomer subunit delta n=1 Tax=Wickerhamomyces pijperi TaxID=599730 RepID=A0A9P8PW54_WICPI|nr:hypothetical protein WICPIJ_008621 [Wickerhamomyces pijperi]
MAVLAASIITRSGKAILSRQFKDLTKNRVTELLANFPALLADNNTEHTTVEDDQVRYVYQPLDDLYLVLITNRQSNILQDIDTLNLFTETVTSMLRSINEHEIFDRAFEILSAFDEIVTLGYKENLSLLQIKTFLEMDSHEERIQEIIERNKEMEANEERKRRAKEIQRKELERRSTQGAGSYGGGNAVGFQQQQQQAAGYDSYRTEYQTPQQSYNPTPVEPQSTYNARPAPKGKGLQLGKSSKKQSFASSGASAAEPLIAPQPEQYNQAPPPPQQQQQYHQPQQQQHIQQHQSSKPVNNGILVTLEEKITAEITREGSVNASELKGVLQLRIADPELAHCKLLLQVGNANSKDLQFKTHPNVDRGLFTASSVIALKNSDKPFPSNDQNLGVLRWRGVGKQDDTQFLPVQITTWLSANDNNTVDVTLELELADHYKDSINELSILVPIATENVQLTGDEGSVEQITEEGVLFKISNLSSGEQKVLEFTIESGSEEELFPIEVGFVNENPVNNLGQVKVLDIVSVADEESLSFDLNSELATDSYFIV